MPTAPPSDRHNQNRPAVADPETRRLTEVVNQLRRALRASIRTDIPWEALPMAQVELLQTLAERSPARISDLADRLHLAPSTVSGLISQMMTSGLIARDTDPSDRRAAEVTLTTTGRSQLTEWEQAHEQRISAAFESLAAEDRQAISSALPALGRLTSRLNSSSSGSP